MEAIFQNIGRLLEDLTGWILGIVGAITIVMVIIQVIGLMTATDAAVQNQKKSNIFKILICGVAAIVITVVVPALFGYFQ